MLARVRTSARFAVALALAAALSVGGLPSPTASAAPSDRAALLRMLNESRARHDLDPLGLDVALSREARKHTAAMIRHDRLYHPALEEILRGVAYERFGAAAVGCARSLRQLHRTLLRSSVHREILLHPNAEMVGIGVLRADSRNRCGRGSYWATYLFYG